MSRKRIGEVLLEAGLITKRDLDEALADQEALGGRIGTILLDKNLITDHEYLLAVSSHMGIPAIDFSKLTIEGRVIKLISKDAAWKQMVLPVKVLKTDSGEQLLLAMAEPRDTDAVNLAQSMTGFKVRPAMALERDIRKVLMEYYDSNYGQGDYRYSADNLQQGPARKEPLRAESGAAPEELSLANPPAPEAKPDDDVLLDRSGREASDGHAEFEDKLIAEVANVKLATEAVLRLLVLKGVITAEEYRDTLRELRLKHLGKAGTLLKK
jgi:hypothetical protein